MRKRLYVYTFYRFIDLKKIKILKKNLDIFSSNKIIYGTVLIANEGVNGTISGEKNDLNDFISYLKKSLKINKISLKISKNQFIPFYRLKIKLKNEIVTIGDKSIKPEKLSGKHIPPKDWDKILSDKEYMIFDTRNDYEIKIGTFKNSINPHTKSFREFPNYIKKQKINKKQKIAMFCTGGIRCEKASSYLLQKGFKNIYQLEGGILNYLEFKKNKKNSSWTGECFVFDNRVSIDKNLNKGKYDQCYGCRHPITKNDKKLKSYIKGAACKYCIKNKSTSKLHSSITRQKQIDSAESKNVHHPFKKIYVK
jgi:UPF0176 protein